MKKKQCPRGMSELIDTLLNRAMMRGGRWVMVKMKLPPIENGPPPVMSIHWAVSWPMKKEACQAWFQRHYRLEDFQDVPGPFHEEWIEKVDQKINQIIQTDFNICAFGAGDSNPFLCWKIKWKGNDVRLFEHEVSAVTDENMNLYIREGSHELVNGETPAEEQMFNDVLNGDKKTYYEAAVLDGCTHNQALQVALGLIVDPGACSLPPIGWYRCREEVIEYFFGEVKDEEPVPCETA